MWCTITIDLFKGLKKIASTGIIVDSPTRRVGESFFDYKYLREYEAQIGTARNVVYGTYAEPISAKTPENPPRCHVPLSKDHKGWLTRIQVATTNTTVHAFKFQTDREKITAVPIYWIFLLSFLQH